MNSESVIELRYLTYITSLRAMCEACKAASRALREDLKYESWNSHDRFPTTAKHFVEVLRYLGEMCCRIPALHELSTLKIASYTSKVISNPGRNEDLNQLLRDLRWLDVADKIDDTLLNHCSGLHSQLCGENYHLLDWNSVISQEERMLLLEIRKFIGSEFDPWAQQVILSLKNYLGSPDSFAGRLSYLMAIIEVGEIVPLLLSPQNHYCADTIRLLKHGRDFFSKLRLNSVCELQHVSYLETFQEANEELFSLLEAVLPGKPVVGLNGVRQLENVIQKFKIKETQKRPEVSAKVKGEEEAKNFLKKIFPGHERYNESRVHIREYYSKVKEVKKDSRRRRSSGSTECTNAQPQERNANVYIVDNTIHSRDSAETGRKIKTGIPKETHLKVLTLIESTQENHESHLKVKEQHEYALQQREKHREPLIKMLSGNSSDDVKKKLDKLHNSPDTNKQRKNDHELLSDKPDIEKSLETICDEVLNERGSEIQMAMGHLQEMLDIDTNAKFLPCLRSHPSDVLSQHDLFEHIKKVFSRGRHGNVASAARYLIGSINNCFCEWSISKKTPNLKKLLRSFRNFHFHAHRFFKTPLLAGSNFDQQYDDELELANHVTICIWELLPVLASTAHSKQMP